MLSTRNRWLPVRATPRSSLERSSAACIGAAAAWAAAAGPPSCRPATSVRKTFCSFMDAAHVRVCFGARTHLALSSVSKRVRWTGTFGYCCAIVWGDEGEATARVSGANGGRMNGWVDGVRWDGIGRGISFFLGVGLLQISVCATPPRSVSCPLIRFGFFGLSCTEHTAGTHAPFAKGEWTPVSAHGSRGESMMAQGRGGKGGIRRAAKAARCAPS